MQQKKWLDEKHKIPTNKMTKPFNKSILDININKIIIDTFKLYLRLILKRFKMFNVIFQSSNEYSSFLLISLISWLCPIWY